MCQPASFVIADNGKKAFWSKYTDSHEEIIREFELVEMVANKITFVRVEISPDSGNLIDPFDNWIFNTNQDILPEWYDPAEAEKLCRAELPAWFESKVFVDGIHEIYKGLAYAYAKSSVEAWGLSSVVARESSSVVARESSRVEAWGSSSVEAWESSRVEAWESSSVVAWGLSSVEAWGSSSVVANDDTTINQLSSKSIVILFNNAVCIDRSNGKPVIHVAWE